MRVLYCCIAWPAMAALMPTDPTHRNDRCPMRQRWSCIFLAGIHRSLNCQGFRSTLCCPRSCKAGKGSPDEYYFNPLKCPLPKAPKMEMFCLYGVGIPTERSYYYLNLESEEVMHSTSIGDVIAL